MRYSRRLALVQTTTFADRCNQRRLLSNRSDSFLEMNALQIFCYSHAVEGFSPFSGADHAMQRTPGFGVQLPSAALIRPAQSRAVLPAMKPGTARHSPRLRLAPPCSHPRPRPGVAELGVVRRHPVGRVSEAIKS